MKFQDYLCMQMFLIVKSKPCDIELLNIQIIFQIYLIFFYWLIDLKTFDKILY